jgi:hypothetical protein
MNLQQVLERGYRIHLINGINDLLIRFTGEGLTEEGIQKRMTWDIEKLELEYQNKKIAYNMQELNWN